MQIIKPHGFKQGSGYKRLQLKYQSQQKATFEK